MMPHLMDSNFTPSPLSPDLKIATEKTTQTCSSSAMEQEKFKAESTLLVARCQHLHKVSISRTITTVITSLSLNQDLLIMRRSFTFK